MSGLYQPKHLRKHEMRFIALFLRVLKGKKLDAGDAARLEAYGRAFNSLGLVFNKVVLAPVSADPASFLTAHQLLAVMSQTNRLPPFFEEQGLQDICLNLGKTRTELETEARSQTPPHSLDEYFLASQKFSPLMNQAGNEIKGFFEKRIGVIDGVNDLPLICLDSCLLTVGLLALLSNNTPTARRELISKGINSHPQVKVHLVKENSPRVIDKPLAAELIFKIDSELIAVNYLNDSNFVPLGKAKP